jgi:hypothetical protein
MIEVTIIRLSNARKSLPKIIKFEKILIDPKTGKETKVQRAARIAETQNGRKLRTRQVQSKRRKLTEKAVRMAEKGA